MRAPIAKKLKGSRDGFTLIELLIALVILGLLSGIVISRMWVVKDRSNWAAIKSDLRNVANMQEQYFNSNQQYATSVSDLADFTPSEGVTIDVTWTANTGWAGTGTHATFDAGEQCGYFTGPAAAGIAPPATEQGKITCTE